MTTTSVDRHAEAIAQVQDMRDTIRDQNQVIISLQRDLQTERDRVHILLEERARWRTDALACRTFVVKLATIQEQVNQATVGAANILNEMAIMDAAETPKAAITEASTSIEEQLKKLRRIENANNEDEESAVSSLQERAPSHS